mgnify:CR=1 FL=1|tara:strand:+ start:1125 stop:1859 length:735 start_codon:yes stop_codon:yes gene_type:complete
MKFKFLPLLFILLSCSTHLTTINSKKPYSSSGFAYIYNNFDFNEKIIKGKMNNDKIQLSHQNLRTGTLIKITNPKNNKTLVLKNLKRIKYPDFYQILLTEAAARELSLNTNLPIIEIDEIKKNKSFVAKKAKIFNEEKKIPSKAPVASVKISNISKNKQSITKKDKDKIFIKIASFYSLETAKFLKNRIKKEIPELNYKRLKIKKINNKETQVILGPYISVNSLKNDYIKLKNYGFEELGVIYQ